jgi:AraC-like DNA-binding protein
MAERNPLEAALQLRPGGEVPAESDWPDRLALVLATSHDQKLGDWAGAIGIAPETLSRGFRAAFGITPARFRVEARARRAMEMIDQGGVGLAAVAADCGYADQSHLNRAIVELTGQPPGAWRKSNSFKSSMRFSG